MKEIYWSSEPSNGRLAIMPCPWGGDHLREQIRGLRREGVDVVVSLLPAREAALLDLLYEAEICEKNGITYLSFPIEDRSIPESLEQATGFVDTMAALLEEGKSVAIHCRAGIGRSALIAASVLVRNGMSGEEAFDRIRLARECDVPDRPAQRTWVMAFADQIRSRER